MKVKNGFILREVANQYIVVPTGNRTLDFNGIITLNNSGKYLWDNLQDSITYGDLVNLIVNKYEVTKEVAIRDVKEFIDNLNKHNILE